MDKRAILASAAIRTRAYVYGLVMVTGLVTVLLTVDISLQVPEVLGPRGVAVCGAVIGSSAMMASAIQFGLLSLLNGLYSPRTRFERLVLTMESSALGGLAGGLIGGALLSWLVRAWLQHSLRQVDSFVLVPLVSVVVMMSAAQVRFWLVEASRERDEANAQLQERARQLEQEARLTDKLLLTLAHESRTPLTSLRVSSDLLVDVGTENDDPVIVKLSQNIGRSVREMAALYGNLEDVSHVLKQDFSLDPQALSVSDLLNTVPASMAPALAAKRQQLKVTNTSTMADFTGDGQGITHVLLALLENASKHSPEGSEIELNVTADGPDLLFEVKDHGEGIPLEEQANIFKPFYRVKDADSQHGAGMGVGLTVAKALAEAHGGTIQVKSSPGEGSSFVVRLPADGPAEK